MWHQNLGLRGKISDFKRRQMLPSQIRLFFQQAQIESKVKRVFSFIVFVVFMWSVNRSGLSKTIAEIRIFLPVEIKMSFKMSLS